MLVLGIESTAHTFGVGIVRGENIFANVWDMYTTEPGKGIIPIESANHHEKVKNQVLEKALKKADVKIEDIDVISFSHGAGLPPCLKVGKDFAVELAEKHKKPLVPVCHQVAHIDIGKLLTGSCNPVVLFTSGANTQVLAFEDGYYRCFGETMDVGIGNALDKFGRAAGLGFPAGPKIEELARKSKNYIELPYVVKGMDLSFSGIITSTINKLKKEKIEDLCYSLQETLFSMLTEVTERALAHTEREELLLTGGVAANKRLNEMLTKMCKERGANVYNVPKEYAGDNGAMIAYSGLLSYSAGITVDPKKADFNPRLRTDQWEVKWEQI